MALPSFHWDLSTPTWVLNLEPPACTACAPLLSYVPSAIVHQKVTILGPNSQSSSFPSFATESYSCLLRNMPHCILSCLGSGLQPCTAIPYTTAEKLVLLNLMVLSSREGYIAWWFLESWSELQNGKGKVFSRWRKYLFVSPLATNQF